MTKLKSLDAFGSAIHDLTGFEFATNLTELHLGPTLSRMYPTRKFDKSYMALSYRQPNLGSFGRKEHPSVCQY